MSITYFCRSEFKQIYIDFKHFARLFVSIDFYFTAGAMFHAKCHGLETQVKEVGQRGVIGRACKSGKVGIFIHLSAETTENYRITVSGDIKLFTALQDGQCN